MNKDHLTEAQKQVNLALVYLNEAIEESQMSYCFIFSNQITQRKYLQQTLNLLNVLLAKEQLDELTNPSPTQSQHDQPQA